MAGDDEIIRDYEAELGQPGSDPGSSNRRFWLVFAAIGVACAFTLVEIFANLGLKESIAHAQATLRAAQAAAEAIEARDGTFESASADAMAIPGLVVVGAEVGSTGLDEVSVSAGVSEWAAAVQARPGACFYLRISGEVVTYGAGSDCTGQRALEAVDDRW